jgi:UDP:flavonoid glycosyltransferase YjiC (YdhE family)
MLLENPSYSKAAARIAEVVHQEHGAVAAVDEIEEILRTKDG